MASEELNDEICAIKAIYPECIEEESPLRYKFKVPQHEHIAFEMTFPGNYPGGKPEILSVSCGQKKAGYDEGYLMRLFQEVLDSVFQKDCVVVFDFFTELEGILYDEEGEEEKDDGDHWDTTDTNTHHTDNDDLTAGVSKLTIETASNTVDHTDYKYDETAEKAQAQNPKERTSSDGRSVSKAENPDTDDCFADWSISEVIKDRKSTFVGFATKVHSVNDVNSKFNKLLTDRKIQKANHLMRAYRIKRPNSDVIFEDCDDDGEAAAGSRLLHLLNLMDAWDVYVVVARWFGGVHIGPVRFRHINECARDALVSGSLVQRETKDGKGKKKKGKKK